MAGYTSDHRDRNTQHCLACDRSFRTRAQLHKHTRMTHRRRHPVRSTAQPQDIPLDVESVTVKAVYFGNATPPSGFRSRQYPLARVNFTHQGQATKNAICDYRMLRERFPIDLCIYWMSRIDLIPFKDQQRHH